MRATLYKNARLLDPASRLDAKGAVLVRDGKIAEVGPNVFVDAIQADAEVVDCGGRCLAPGLVDMRVQTREPGEEHMETLASLQHAAVAGGVTTLATLPNTNPIIDDVSLLEFVERLAQEVGLVNVHPYAAATKGMRGEEMTEIGLLSASGAVGFTDGTKAIADPVVMRRLLSYATMFGRPVIQHPEEPTLAREGCATEGETATRLGLPGIPSCAEVMMIERDLQLVRLTGGRYHAAHVSTGAAIEAIRRAKAEGLAVTCDTAPHYFALNELAIVDYRTFARMSPPLRSEADRRAVVAGVADGTIDAIASDHNPEDQDSKRVPFAQAVPGAVGLETLLPISLGLHHDGAMPLLDIIDRLTARPAAILGLEVGRLSVGAWADLVVFEPDRAVRIDASKFRSKSKNSPFDGKPAQGRVWRTVYRGRTVFDLDTEASGPRSRRESAHA
ncbi:Dihydroorotase and related cyclic amidohydrolase [alpha proteobacterium BAL199]|nr:Dihydroorotase and related cyclic amidohydrolase [alpha proteobacterium BAL199]